MLRIQLFIDTNILKNELLMLTCYFRLTFRKLGTFVNLVVR